MNDSDSDIVPAAITDDVQNARRDYQTLLTEATQTLASYCKKLKPSIEKARPYFDLLKTRKQLLQDLQLNSQDYRAAQSEHDDAASILDCFNANVARFGESDESDLDEVNKAVEKVHSGQQPRSSTPKQDIHLKKKVLLCVKDGSYCERPYFDSKAFYNQRMETVDENNGVRKLFTNMKPLLHTPVLLYLLSLWGSSNDVSISQTLLIGCFVAAVSTVLVTDWTYFHFPLKDAKRRIDKLTEGLKTNKRLYTQTMRSLEAISNRIHESRRLGQWLNSPPPHPPRSASRSLGVGAEGSTTTTAEFGEGCPSLSLPSSPRHTPSGQADTDTEEEGGSSVFDQRFATSEGVSKLDQQPLIDGLLMVGFRLFLMLPPSASRSEDVNPCRFSPPLIYQALRSCSRIPVSENFSASEFDPPNALNQTDPPLLQNGANYQQFPPIASASRHSRSRSL
ncbi:unnamed protein product [Mesocestoides corti]|uniref:Uncharacterized protein n=1 Tax=Mesocestoides corti TaxID=53468 RepID=A0A0R3U623_MESCO|nr:unnamed protein product [Mesocestoides corti]